MKRLTYLSVALVFLGCSNNFNRYELPQPAVVQTVKDKPAALRCPIFLPSELPDMPKLPANQILDDPKITLSQIEKVERRYIEELRAHVLEIRKTYRRDYDRYLDTCLKDGL